MNIKTLDLKIIAWLKRSYLPLARIAVFIIYFYFGFLKVLGESPATPLAKALIDKLGMTPHFDTLYVILAVLECLIGVLFLFPRLTRIVIPLLLLHMIIVCSPLFLIPDQAFVKPFVPSLEGQYIMKNAAIIVLALGVAAQTPPLAKRKNRKS